MAEVKFQPSQRVESFFSEDLGNDSERFLLFLKAYYEWLQTTKITYTSLSGTLQRDEVVTGTSGATATIKEVGTGYIIVLVSSRVPFEIGETITGETSNATATVSTTKENVVRASGNLLNNRYIETTIDQYQDYLKAELYDSLPKEFLGDKRTIALKFKKYFESKSNEESYRFLFRLLYDEPIEFYYPGEDILRPSDGKFEKTNILRVEATANVFNFLEKTIRGETSNSLANVVDIKTFFIGGIEIAEFTLKLVSGTFSTGETIVDVDDATLTTTVYGIVADFVINDGGSGYSLGDVITITGDGSEAQARVSSISDAPISTLKINEVGHGYQLNTEATINESGTGGSGLLVRVTELANTYSYTDANTSNTYVLGEVSRVQILNRGSEYISAPTITLQDTTISSLGLLSDKLITIVDGGSDYGVGNTLVFTGSSGANAAGIVASVEEAITYDLLFEDGFRMLSEDSYDDIIKTEEWDVLGAITRVELTNFGDGYTVDDLPTITVTSTTGSSANLIATDIQGRNANVVVDIANNTIGIGAIRDVEITNFGIDYTSATADATGIGDGNANLSITISGLGISDGGWVNDDGKLNYKYIQDSFFYQDFSYVIKSGLAFNFYKDTIKSIIHPAGFQPFGEIQITAFLNVSARILSSAVTSEIQQYLVYIESFFNVAPAYAESFIFREIQIERPIDVSSDLLSNKEYVIKLPTAEIETSFESTQRYELDILLSGDATLTIDLAMQVLSSENNSQVIQYIISNVDAFPAYGITYGNLKFVGTGVYDIDWSNSPISVLANNRFNEYYESTTGTKLYAEIEISSSGSSPVSFTQSKINYSIEKLIQTEPQAIASTIDKFIQISANSEIQTQTELSKFVKSFTEIQTEFTFVSYDVEIENSMIDEITTESSISPIIESFNSFDALSFDVVTNKYKQIQGTVSSALGSQYQDLTLEPFSDVQITTISSSTFLSSLTLLVGTNTTFTIDYSIGDVIVANNEYFKVTNVFGNTQLVIDREPSSAFSNISAYKAI